VSWPQVKLESIFDIARGGSPRPIDDYITDADDGVNWISIKDASNSAKYIEKTKLKIKPEGLSKTRMVKPGDFLLTNSMSFGRPYIMRTTGCIHDGWLVLSGDPERVDSNYFYHLLGSDLLKRRFSALAAGAVVKNLNIDLVKGVEIPLPPLPEQKRIAAILDKADAIRRKRQQAIQLADDFLRAVFLDMFGDPVTNPKGWEVSSLDQYLEFLTSGSRGWAKYYSDSGSKFIRIQNVGKNKLLLTDMAYVNAPKGAEAARTKVQAGDVLLSITADLGRSSVVTSDIEGGYVNQHLAILRLNKYELNSRYLSAYLSSDAGVRQFFVKNKSAVKAGINFSDIRSLEIQVPPISLQRSYENLYERVMGFQLRQAENLDVAEAAFSSLSQKAFRGEL
jgi:type I restriction enzyme, S subunit